MAVTVPPSGDAFARLARWVEDCCSDERLCLHDGDCADQPTTDTCLPLGSVREVIARKGPTGAERARLWQEIARRVRDEREGEQERRWMMIALWLVAPRLKGIAWSINRRRRAAELGDVCSAVLMGAMEGLVTAAEENPGGIEKDLVDAAYAAGWRTRRRPPQEVPMEEISHARGNPLPPAADSEPLVGEVVRVGTVTAPLVQRANGERLGALAQRLGLLPHVRDVRRRRRAGKWPERTDDDRPTAWQQSLFDGECG